MNDKAVSIVTLGHGSGGRLTRELIRDVFVSKLTNPHLAPLGDAALLGVIGGPVALTTDGFVVSPLEFAGGDIGALAINGTVNDLSVAGAVPLYLSASFVLEEGLSLAVLERLAASMAAAARAAGVSVVTGDTKVVERGHGDGVFITTAGIGRVRELAPSGVSQISAGDALLVSGPLGDHGAVIAAHRSGIDPGGLRSDCGPVTRLVDALYAAGVRPRLMRDPTRGGLATILAELAHETGLSIELEETSLPVRPATRTVCDLLGLDPLYLACEGRLVAVVSGSDSDRALAALRTVEPDAALVGSVVAPCDAPVVLRTRYGGARVYDMLAADQLPRIC